MDELTEFNKNVLEVLRGPLEDQKVTISRLNMSITYPSNFIFIASMNPCPCGYYGSSNKECSCKPEQIKKYINKISGPLLDRIDLHIEVEGVEYEKLENNEKVERSAEIRRRVNNARKIQLKRYENYSIFSNSELTPSLTQRHCKLDKQCKQILANAFEKLRFKCKSIWKNIKGSEDNSRFRQLKRNSSKTFSRSNTIQKFRQKILGKLKREAIKIIKITIESKEYPEKLRKIKNPPRQLYLEGNIKLLEKNIISIIGSRNGTESGKRIAKKFASELSNQGIVIASGMAIGIDTAAHLGTLEAKGKTIAVLGNGFKHIFPKENINLYKEIIEKGGLVITEYPQDTKANSNLFLERNRIVSGISIGVLVVEASHRSGTSVTARIAKEQNKKVFVLPHDIEEKYGIGTNRLIRKGATLVTSTKEIIEEYPFIKYKKIPKVEEKKEKIEKKVPRNREHKKIYKLIKTGENSINGLYKKSGKSITEINNILFMLEIEGYIKKVAGGYKCI